MVISDLSSTIPQRVRRPELSTLAAMRSIVHALRGWPTPLGATLNTTEKVFDATGACADEKAAMQLAMVGRHVVEFAHKYRR